MLSAASSVSGGLVSYEEQIKIIRESTRPEPIVRSLRLRFNITFFLLKIVLIGCAVPAQVQNAFDISTDSPRLKRAFMQLLSNSKLIISVAKKISYITGDISFFFF
jgi:hypothetical protein